MMNNSIFQMLWIVLFAIVAATIYMVVIYGENLGKPLYRDQYKCAQY